MVFKCHISALFIKELRCFLKYLFIDRTDSDDSRLELPAGQHCLPFKFQLPTRPLPCSFEGTLGYVRYFTRAVIDRPWTFDHVTKRAFTVSGIPYDLNKVQNPLVRLFNIFLYRLMLLQIKLHNYLSYRPTMEVKLGIYISAIIIVENHGDFHKLYYFWFTSIYRLKL